MISSLNPFSTKPPAIPENEEKSNTTDSANRAAATAAADKVYEEIPHSQRKNNELASLLETYW
jgi:alkaline phosphatase